MSKSKKRTEPERYYYANGEKIPLHPSEKYKAVSTVTHGEGVESNGAPTAAGTLQINIPGYAVTLAEIDGPEAGVDLRSSAANAPVEVFEAVSDPEQSLMITTGELIVKFKSENSEETLLEMSEKYGLGLKTAHYPEPDAYLMTVAKGTDVIATANKLQEEASVEFAQPNFLHIGQRLHVPSKADAPYIGAMADPGFGMQWNLQKIKAPEAWGFTTGNPAISVAVLDEGCDMTHEDISYKLPGYDAFALDDNPQPNGNDAHGTAAAGIIAMRKDNNLGGVGVAPQCRVIGVRIAQGIGGGRWATTDAMIADGIRKAVDGPRSADVLSNSYGGGAPSTAITNAFVYAQITGRGGLGCPIAISAGNFGAPETPTNRTVRYPALLSPSIPGVMAVSASNEWDQLKTPFSWDGENWWGSCYGPEVDVAAPGVHIYTADIMGTSGYGLTNYTGGFNGTSAAAPHVAGLMALILSADPGLNAWEVEDIIKMTADDLGAAGRDQQFGFGRINCQRALEATQRLWFEIVIQPVFLGSGLDCYMQIDLRIYNPGINTVRLDGFAISSHTGDWSAEVDRFEYLPNPGNVLNPRTGEDVRFRRILLKANGNAYGWSYAWNFHRWYTYWRPGGPGLARAAAPLPNMDNGIKIKDSQVKGSGQSGQASTPKGGNGQSFEPGVGGQISVDKDSKTVNIVIH